MTEPRNDVILSPLVTSGLAKYMSFSFHRCIERALLAFVELGIADLMTEHEVPLTALELSQLNGNNWHAPSLYRLLRAIAAADVVKELPANDANTENDVCPENENLFQLTDDGLLLTSNHPSKARDLIRLELGPMIQKPYAYLPSLIQHGNKNGNGFEQTFGCSLFDYLQKEENEETSTVFNNAMIAYSNYPTLSVSSDVDFSRFETLVDIGGGLGTLLSTILEKNHQLNGIAFDLAHVIEDAQKRSPNAFEQKQIAMSRYKFASGDMFKPETVPQADSYILKCIIHDWNDDDSIKILESIRSANKSREKKCITVFLVEMLIVPDNIHNWVARATDIVMLSLLSAKERTIGEYIQLLKKGGYEFKKLYETNGPYSVVEAITSTDISD